MPAGRGAARHRVAVIAAVLSLLVLPWTAIAQTNEAGGRPTSAPPDVAREFRGVWVASVSNIDWPSRPGLPVELQQAELRTILDRVAQLGLNGVVLQIRPAADALYASELEPWSEYLTGRMGQPPEPFYDPLAFAVEEAHARGLELHAWFNPFRARHPSARSEITDQHISRTRPELVRQYGRHLWLDPGDDAVQDHSVRVVLDVVRRYDVDGVHIDDYFYPYKERDSAGLLLDFPDSATFARYAGAGGVLGRDDWRRHNVDRFVERLYRGVKAEKRWVKVGVSPFGIWRPGTPPQIRGFDPYEQIYADSRRWLEQGWLDYFSPQLYWRIDAPEQSYPVLLEWWLQVNPHQRHVWPGNFTSRVASRTEPTWPPGELVQQIRLTRSQPGATGNIHFSARALMENRGGFSDSLRADLYREPALVPRTIWLGRARPGAPRIRLWDEDVEHGELTLTFTPAGRVAPAWWVVRGRYGNEWHTEILPGSRRSHTLFAPPGHRVADEVALSAVSRTGVEGPSTRRRFRTR